MTQNLGKLMYQQIGVKKTPNGLAKVEGEIAHKVRVARRDYIIRHKPK
jgi:hypothetical protein